MDKKRIKIILPIIIVIITLLFIFIPNILDDYDKDISTVLLEKIYSFPSEDADTLLARPRSIQIYDNYLFVTDHLLSSILVFTINGKHVNMLGRKGSGPGEFISPTDLIVRNDTIVVLDWGNRRIQILESNGDYIQSIRYKQNVLTFTYGGDYIYIHRLYLPFHNTNVSDIKLIGIIDHRGNLLNEFGDYLNIVPGIIPFASWPILQIHNAKLYSLFKHYPILNVYNLNGDLIRSIEFDHLDYSSLVPNNYKKDTFSDLRHIPLQDLFTSFNVTDDGLYLALYGNDIIIDHYDYDGTFINRYVYKSNNHVDDYIIDFQITRVNEELYFYIISEAPYPKVSVYSIIK